MASAFGVGIFKGNFQDCEPDIDVNYLVPFDSDLVRVFTARYEYEITKRPEVELTEFFYPKIWEENVFVESCDCLHSEHLTPNEAIHPINTKFDWRERDTVLTVRWTNGFSHLCKDCWVDHYLKATRITNREVIAKQKIIPELTKREIVLTLFPFEAETFMRMRRVGNGINNVPRF